MSKVSKEKAKYQNSPKEGDMCRNCTMFRPPSSCTTVEGVINPKGWCKYFEQKERTPLIDRSPE